MSRRITQLIVLILQSIACMSLQNDTLSAGVMIRHPQTIASQKQIYKLGFFTPPNTTNRYLGIFFAFSQETVVWVANRDTPLKDSSGAVTLSRDGNLIVLDGTNQTIWSTNVTTTSPINPVVQILDTGNLVLREEASGDTLWESFSHPTDILMQGMTLSQNVKTGKQSLLTSWKNATDPGIGSFTGGLDVTSGIPQLVIWNEGRLHWRSGRRNQLQCGDDGFERLRRLKVPDFAKPSPSRVQDECRTRCLGNCSCIAYAYDNNIGCMFWSDTLIDTREFDSVGVDLYVRLSASEFDSHTERKLYIIIGVTVGFVCISVMMFIAWWLIVKRKGNRAQDSSIMEAGQMFMTDSTAIVLKNESKEVNIGDLTKFTFEMLANATNQFHVDNLLGRGGFGPVYKGVLANKKEIAVKRLSAESGQGMQEFMNEVIVISKLQHRNLVKLLGGCVEKEEKILIYEYMPNKSLDACLFGSTNPTKKLLDWNMRSSIIEGIGRGILYLHRDSRLRIIHRDLKPSNVLLDQGWNPKISDFGMARIFGGNEDHVSTARVVGTYGYMAPEYGMEGRFSEKSDVYSFGVLILEIIKGKKNTRYFNDELSLSLIGCAWKMWSEGDGLSFVEESIASRETEEEMVRCIQIGLLCVQESPNNRPAIQTVLSMLSGEIVELPVPKQPVFAENGSTLGPNGSTQQNVYSNNELTLSVLDGR
ncbi:non-specific serine/threonine protein kinase [Salvia divinorum]|uniref:Receptor-like serine/threonine-protein kinase n=1 Tax=Salvia divinorum TaxID=28513 RepID=A0ABD1G0G8_SALDI